MRTKVSVFIFLISMMMLVCQAAQAADSTDTLGATVTGTSALELTITSSDLIVDAPSGAGPSTTTFDNSPIEIEIMDNEITLLGGRGIIAAKIDSELPQQYGTGNTYYIRLDTPSFSPAADSEITSGEISPIAVDLGLADQWVMRLGFSASGQVIHGTFSQPAQLVINSDKRVHGDTSDNITIMYTMHDDN